MIRQLRIVKSGIERDLSIGWGEPICGEDWKCQVGSTARPVQLPAGRHCAEIAEVVAHVALNIFTNYFNNVAGTTIDLPKAPALSA
jgi:hypothetical protein